jgi:hypothetical protein
MRTILAAACAALLIAVSSSARADGIQGDYVEARTADVYTGPCFSNAEVFIYGKQAVMAWKVRQGSWNGVDLSGLCVAAAVQASTTLSEDQPARAESVLMIDRKANTAQRAALIGLARELGGERLSKVVAVKTVHMSLKVEDHGAADSAAAAHHTAHGMPQTPPATFWASGLAQIVTRPLDERDHACGNEVVAYPPLSRGVTAKPAFTLGHQFQGESLNNRWDDPNCRSSFVGHFAL